MSVETIFSKEQINLSTFIFERGGRVLFQSESEMTRIADIGIREETFTLKRPAGRGATQIIACPVYRITGTSKGALSLNGIIRAPIALANNGGETTILPPEFHYVLHANNGFYLGQSIALHEESLLASMTFTKDFDMRNVGAGFTVKLPVISRTAYFKRQD